MHSFKVLITGNMGYVGPGVVKSLRRTYPGAELIGYDTGFFAGCLTGSYILPEHQLDRQLFGDVRNISSALLEGIDIVIHLAAISNDPMGLKYEDVTLEVNYQSTVHLARMAKSAGVSCFVFASSCSIYGAADSVRDEQSQLDPLTAYARSKVLSENGLKELADDSFKVTCLRFATACGMSDRLRLDLVLNDFVAGALVSRKINILSDGTPWRPLINVLDMARAIEWAIVRPVAAGGTFLAINAGSEEWNYQVVDLARSVAEELGDIEILLNKNAVPDKRSYRVSFSLFKELAPGFQPAYSLSQTVKDLYQGLKNMNFGDENYRESSLIRLKVLNNLQQQSLITNDLYWSEKKVMQSVLNESGIEV